MRASIVFPALAAVLIAILALPAAGAPGPKVKAVVSVEGVVTGIDAARSSFTIRVLTPGHQRQVGSSTMTILVQAGTDLRDTSTERGGEGAGVGRASIRGTAIGDLRVGDKVHVQTIRLDNGQFLAMRVVVQNRRLEDQRRSGTEISQGQAVEFQGVVVGKGDRTLRVRQNNGAVRTVLVPSTADIAGRAASFREIKIGDLVLVRGTVNADGTVVARRIEVLRSVSSAGSSTTGKTPSLSGNEASATGAIVFKNTTGLQFFLLSSGQAVSVTPTTQIVSEGKSRSFDDLKVGMTVTVFGVPLTVAGLTVGINAVLILY